MFLLNLFLAGIWSAIGYWLIAGALVGGAIFTSVMGWPKVFPNVLALALVAHLVGGWIYARGEAACEAP